MTPISTNFHTFIHVQVSNSYNQNTLFFQCILAYVLHQLYTSKFIHGLCIYVSACTYLDTHVNQHTHIMLRCQFFYVCRPTLLVTIAYNSLSKLPATSTLSTHTCLYQYMTPCLSFCCCCFVVVVVVLGTSKSKDWRHV